MDPPTEEEPGKILHEVRFGVSSGLALSGKNTYYGSVDATPLFVNVLGAVSRWGFARETIAALLPHADRALEWIRDYGDKDGDGFVEYKHLNAQGLTRAGRIPGVGSTSPTGPSRKHRSRSAKCRHTSTVRTCPGHGWPMMQATGRLLLSLRNVLPG